MSCVRYSDVRDDDVNEENEILQAIEIIRLTGKWNMITEFNLYQPYIFSFLGFFGSILSIHTALNADMKTWFLWLNKIDNNSRNIISALPYNLEFMKCAKKWKTTEEENIFDELKRKWDKHNVKSLDEIWEGEWLVFLLEYLYKKCKRVGTKIIKDDPHLKVRYGNSETSKIMFGSMYIKLQI